jgi:hypothetical protein
MNGMVRPGLFNRASAEAATTHLPVFKDDVSLAMSDNISAATFGRQRDAGGQAGQQDC